jgi:hypothetical protein
MEIVLPRATDLSGIDHRRYKIVSNSETGVIIKLSPQAARALRSWASGRTDFAAVLMEWLQNKH